MYIYIVHHSKASRPPPISQIRSGRFARKTAQVQLLVAPVRQPSGELLVCESRRDRSRACRRRRPGTRAPTIAHRPGRGKVQRGTVRQRDDSRLPRSPVHEACRVQSFELSTGGLLNASHSTLHGPSSPGFASGLPHAVTGQKCEGAPILGCRSGIDRTSEPLGRDS